MPNLTVPHRRQLDFGYCLPACVEMVLAYYGIARSQFEIAAQLGLIEGVGMPASRVVRLVSPNLNVTRRTGEWPQLVAALESNTPPIVEVRINQLPYWDEDTFHVVLLTGIEGDIAQVNDPAFDKSINVFAADLQLAWDESDNHFALIERR